MLSEVDSWPYDFIQSQDFLSSDRRGSFAGQLLVRDRYVTLVRSYLHNFSTNIQVMLTVRNVIYIYIGTAIRN